MKFDAVIGNPPYQIEGDNTRKAPIYNLFYDLAFQLSDVATLISPARFLFRAGQTPEEWTERMLNDTHIKVAQYFPNSTAVFETVDIKGGVAILLRDAKANFGKIGTFSAQPELSSITKKVGALSDHSLTEIVSAKGVYKFTEKVFTDFPNASQVQGKGTKAQITSNSMQGLPEVFTSEKTSPNSIQMIGLVDKKRAIRWTRKEYVQTNDFIHKYECLRS